MEGAMESVGYEPRPYEIALFEQDMAPPLSPSAVVPAGPPPDALAYLRAMEEAACAGIPFEHFSDEQLARLEELTERRLGIGPDFCTGADD
jgi:hypothetical protein